MTEFTNAYFKKMHDIGTEYEKARSIRKREKEELIKNDNWDAVEAWNQREKSFPFPFSDGADLKLCNRKTRKRGASEAKPACSADNREHESPVGRIFRDRF